MDHDWIQDGSDAHDVAELGDCSVPLPRYNLPRRAIWHESLAAFLLDAVDDGVYLQRPSLIQKVRQMHEAWTVGGQK